MMASDEPVEFVCGQCPQCAEPYRLPSSAKGRKARCRACGGVFVVGEPHADEASTRDSVGVVIRHEERTRKFTPACSTDSINAIDEHIQRYIGPVEQVFHEIASDLVHVDLHWVKPSADQAWHTLVTSGMSDLPMHAPEEMAECRFAEVMIRLPPDWKLAQSDFKDEAWYWPLRWLKILARLPHEYDTWLWQGHSAPNGDPPTPFAANTKLCGLMLAPPRDVPEGFHTLRTGEKQIAFFSMIPLYAEEMTHKIKHGYQSIMARFLRQGISDVLDINRRNVCRPRLFGLF